MLTNEHVIGHCDKKTSIAHTGLEAILLKCNYTKSKLHIKQAVNLDDTNLTQTTETSF